DNQNGTANITIRATDADGKDRKSAVEGNSNAVQDIPTLENAIADVTVNEGAPNTVLDLSNAFADADILTNSDSLTLTVQGNTNSSLVTVTLDGNILTLDYGENQNGTANITIRATDADG